MKFNKRIVLSVAVATILSACNATPERNETLERARTLVPEMEQSPRAGIAAGDIANARTSLDAANRLAESKSRKTDMEFEAANAVLSAQIANEKILTAQANEQVAAGSAQRQTVLLQARERDAQRSATRARSLEAELADMKLQKTERGLVLTLGDVLFDTAQATFRAGADAPLDRLAAALKEQPDRQVLIEGHTDNVGSDQNNMLLSERRAQSVQTGLLQRGVDRSQITAVGKGENFPIASNDSAAGRQSNRRVEMIFTDSAAHVGAGSG
ncbi:membrane protein [Steroidobacter agaridevorans]|uniref:Membrane protein n=1 Tax=Steroidobacter agaridevorans TaxID=2695856 RepID=A0A829YCV5_9GAMM|nr:OmpA family protein [Steroidobacter agaridevorans]GFE80671.1 membrane protein [Steroidobacter agaridevorans]